MIDKNNTVWYQFDQGLYGDAVLEVESLLLSVNFKMFLNHSKFLIDIEA